ncbi:MAG: hypothetical protein IPK64_14400 [bacterium]|nr:hypothetical protein [bacterium]
MIRSPLPAAGGLATLLGAGLIAGLFADRATASTSPRILYQDDGAKPATAAQPVARTPFDCTARDTFTLTPALWDTVLTADTTGGPALVPGYGCRPWPEQGPEHIYRLEVTADVQLRAALSDLGTQDLDLFLLDGCDTDACLAGANAELVAVLTPGTWWLVVDGYGTDAPAAGPYALTLETRWVGVPPPVCLPGGAAPVMCAARLDSTLADAPDLMQAYDCSPSLLTGGEVWCELTVPGLHDLSARATPDSRAPTLDLALWLFDGCGPAAVCLGFVDARAGGQQETIDWSNTDAGPITVYLAVDTRRAPDSAVTGSFGLSVDCQSHVAAERRPLGSVKALYR